MASSFWVGQVSGELPAPRSSTWPLSTARALSRSSFCSAKALAFFRLQLWMVLHADSGWSRPPRQQPCSGAQSHVLLGGAPPASQLSVFPPYAMEEVTEELVPEEHEASGECSLHQAGGQALEEAPGALLLEHPLDEVQKAPVAPHLGRGRWGLRRKQ